MEVSDNDRREKELVREWQSKSRAAGDHNWQKANAWSGQGDYTAADYGEAPQGARW